MKIHKNAWLMPLWREEMAQSIIVLQLTKAKAART